jgi:4-hydroxybenzoate polyprenyltransferase
VSLTTRGSVARPPANRLRAVLELIRLPNVFTAPADVAAGLAVSGVALAPAHGALLLASAFAYAGGMALNDAWDAPLDAVERPERPIPSGRLGRATAFWIAAACLLACLALAAVAGPRPLGTAALLVLAIVIYDGFAKESAAGPAFMALCRALNVGLGVAAGALTAAAASPMVVLFAYVLVVTVMSRFEVSEAPVALVRRAAAGLGGILAVAAALVLGWWGRGGMVGLGFLVLLGWWLAGPLRAAMAEPQPSRIIAVIKASVLGIILLDAAFAGAARGVGAGLLVAALFLPAWFLGRRFASA